jgi:hypothetical protein
MASSGLAKQAASVSARWEDWRLGDLSDALRRACDVLGASAPVAWVAVYSPTSPEDVPSIQLAVEDRAALENLRAQIVEGEFPPLFIDDGRDTAFTAGVDDVCLHVWCRKQDDL